MADEEWSTNATEATTISIWQQGKDTPKAISEFQPTFTYPIFGEEESIFGYKDLKIDVGFAAHDLYPNVSWSFDKKFKSVGTTKALDLREALDDFVPAVAFAPHSEFKERIQTEDSSSFQPPGEKVRSWTKNGRQYEIWAGPLTDPRVKTLLDRAQILVSFFIEGGTHLETEDQQWTIARWRVFFLYEKLSSPPSPTASVYSIVGYSTSYRFLTFTKEQEPTKAGTEFEYPSGVDLDVLKLPYRGRISQFLILPSHAHQGHGSMLYATMFKYFLDDPSCVQITIEDPSEAMDDLRDYCDFTHLLQTGTLEQIRMDHNVDPKFTLSNRPVPIDKLVDKPLLATIRKKNKLASRQFARLVEMWLLSRIPSSSRQPGTARLTRKAKSPDEGDRAMYFWRLLVKTRIFKQNRDKLMSDDIERSDVAKHLDDTTDNLLEDYERLLAKLAQRALESPVELDEGDKDSVKIPKRGKRNLVIDDDDEDEEVNDTRSKRQKSAAPPE